MTRLVFVSHLLALGAAVAQRPAQSPPEIPRGAVQYEAARYTQSIFRLDERPTIRPIHVRHLEAKWRHSGGTEGVGGVTSSKYRWLPEGKAVEYRLAGISVKNTFGYFQTELGVVRSYPAGTRFDDVLSYRGRVFEHRVREKQPGGGWESSVVYRSVRDYPPGYAGLKTKCASCHDQSGTGEYGVGLVPGGDTVLSDPLDWTVINRAWTSEGEVR